MVPDGVRSFQDSRFCISVALLPKLVMLPGRDLLIAALFLSSGASSGALKMRLSLLVCVFVCVSLSHCCDIRASCPLHQSLGRFSLVFTSV